MMLQRKYKGFLLWGFYIQLVETSDGCFEGFLSLNPSFIELWGEGEEKKWYSGVSSSHHKYLFMALYAIEVIYVRILMQSKWNLLPAMQEGYHRFYNTKPIIVV